MEVEARKMLNSSPSLSAEFEKKKAAEPAFANDPEAILNWFYSKTPYWDQHINLYPIGRLMDRGKIGSINFIKE